jgi:23S rRNA (guanine2445-N2)-methyltransferase / 23S rRNA (guanine2069-N7)-methyltransferase
VDWGVHFAVERTFMVDASLVRSSLKNENYAALKVKDAVADWFREQGGIRPSVDTAAPDVRISVHVERAHADLYLDISGESLFKRGYRLEAGEAPLRENSAAAILMKAGWSRAASEGSFFLDPMCGSGTFLIEAGLMAADSAPGLERKRWGFSAWLQHDPALWEKLLKEARRRRAEGLGKVPPLFGADIDPEAIRISGENVRRAGLKGKVQLFTGDFRAFDCSVLPRRAGLIAVNPPYGVRLEKQKGVQQLYRDFGRWLSDNFSGSTATVLAPDRETARYLGLQAEKLNTYYNGNLRITAARFFLNEENRYVEYRHSVPNVEDRRGASAAVAPSLLEIGGDETTADETTGVPMIVNRLKKNRRLLKKFLDREGISCYRIYDADIPQYSAAIDIYEDTYAVIQEYAPPKTVDQDRAAQRLQEIVASVPLCFPIEPNHIYLKQRQRQKGDRQYGKLGQEGEFYIVREGELKFFVNFSDYLDTGIFLDHRPTRQLIRRRSEGAWVLNLFAYTCTASVYAADGGAVRTVSVDTSATYLDWGRKNFGLNRIPVEPHLFQRQDSMEFLRTDVDRYNLIFIDPPTFSNRKGAPDVFDVQRDHGMMIDLAVQRLAPGGLIIFSNNFRRFAMDPELEERYLVEEISRDTIPADFERNPKIHRTWLIRRRG